MTDNCKQTSNLWQSWSSYSKRAVPCCYGIVAYKIVFVVHKQRQSCYYGLNSVHWWMFLLSIYLCTRASLIFFRLSWMSGGSPKYWLFITVEYSDQTKKDYCVDSILSFCFCMSEMIKCDVSYFYKNRCYHDYRLLKK